MHVASLKQNFCSGAFPSLQIHICQSEISFFFFRSVFDRIFICKHRQFILSAVRIFFRCRVCSICTSISFRLKFCGFYTLLPVPSRPIIAPAKRSRPQTISRIRLFFFPSSPTAPSPLFLVLPRRFVNAPILFFTSVYLSFTRYLFRYLQVDLFTF